MAEVVTDPNEISLNAVRYQLAGEVQTVLGSIYPPRSVVGDPGRDNNPNASVLALSSWQQGIGVYQSSEPTGIERAWWSTCQLRYKNKLILPGLAVLTAASGVTGTFTVGAIGELASEIYGAFGTSIRKYDNAGDSWGSSLHTLPAVATDVITLRLGGTVYLIFAHTGGYTYTSDGAAFTDDTTDTKFLASWDNRLWGIDNTGQLWFSTAIGTETNDAQLPLPDGYVTDLFVARDAAGDPVLYAATKEGLYAHDIDNTQFVATELALPVHPYGGNGSTVWRDSVYFPAGLGVYQYINGENSAVLTIMGPDRDDGLPSDKRGTIKQLVASHNDLLVVLDGTTAPGTAFDTFDGSTFSSPVIEPDLGYSSILGWDGKGWEVKWLSGSTAKAITYARVSDSYSVYRLWWALADRIYYMRIPSDIINPNEVTDFPYASSSEHITPWYNVGQMEIDKLILRLKVDVLDADTNETVAVSYGLNLATSWTALGTISSDGVTTYEFPNSTTPVGTAYRWIRFKIELASTTTNTITPQVLNLTKEYRKKLPVKLGWQVTISIGEGYKGNTAKQLRAAVIAAVSSATLVEFTFRDDDGGTRNYYVDAILVDDRELTGHDEQGRVSLALMER